VAVVPPVDLPESGVEPTAKRTRPLPRTDGHSDGPAPRLIHVEFFSGPTGGEARIPLEGWCRVGVWTTLEKRTAIPFVVRESWSRLGTRRPRRIGQAKDAVFQGAFVRLRPTEDGQVQFVAEISEARVGPDAEEFEWQDEDIKLVRPRQDGSRFEGHVPAGHVGEIARWGALRITLRDSAAKAGPAATIAFRAGTTTGSVAGGHDARAERYRITVVRKEPIVRDHDGLLQALFRIERARVGTGFEFDDKKGWLVFGDDSLSVIHE